jgi:folate-binding protein YgfZ
VPWRFSSLEAEYRALREGVGLLDYSTQALIEVRGKDRVGFLQALLTNDIARLTPGHGCRAALLDPSARLIAECLVLADPDALWLLCALDQAGGLLQALERSHFSEEVVLTTHERRWAALALQGPRTFEWLRAGLGHAPELREVGDHVRVPPLPWWLIRLDLAAPPGCLILLPVESATAVWQDWVQTGAAHGLRPVGWEALNVARIEAGIPWFGWDMTATSLLPETGLDTTLCSETKGCYVGQEIIARMRTYGSPSKRLMGLRIEGERIPPAGTRLQRDGSDVGWITSSCRSLALEQPIALAYLKRGSYDPGIRVEVILLDAVVQATVVDRRFL